jgi:hypothetical protein
MQTLTDLANAALAYLGDAPVSSIIDADSKPARLCNQFAQAAVDETLRLGRWNRASRRATLVRDAAPPAFGYDCSYQLPDGWLRLLEVNGEPWEDSTQYFALEGDRLLTDQESVELRYIARVPIGACDALCQEAIALRLAAKIAVPLLGNQEMRAIMEALAAQALHRARHIDAVESNGKENPPWNQVMSRSRLLRARGARRNPLRLEDY